MNRDSYAFDFIVEETLRTKVSDVKSFILSGIDEAIESVHDITFESVMNLVEGYHGTK